MAANPRDPANELYDQACSLLAAAQSLRAAASSRRTAPALAASLGCLEASLQQLREAMPELLDTALATAARDQPRRRTHSSEPSELCASFAMLARDLSNSRASCAAARELVGPVVAKHCA
jgi:mannose/cellobiose epimerase-like protein (N-acyl-D-glucosamine 2-epimerase family)